MADKNSMKLMGLNFTKIAGERNPDFDGKVEMSSDLGIKKIEKYKPEMAKADSLKVNFMFNVKYGDLGKVDIEGVLFLGVDSKTMKETLKAWDDKKLSEEFNVTILNLVMQKASLKAFQIEEELGLPIHIRLPKIQVGQKK